jgi:hypothetical protein
MIGGLRDAVQGARLSIIEIIALLLALVFAGVVAFYYFTKVQPLQSQLDGLKAREIAAKDQIEKYNTDEQKRQEQASNAEAILASLRNFEIYLKSDQRGMTEIINEVDALGKKHGVLAGDSSYRVAEADQPMDETGQPKQKASSEDKQKIYPALGIDTNVIGEYPNLRRFLADLERSRQFLIINGLTFQGESDKVRQQTQKTGKSKLQLGAEAVLVTLKVEMDTYFQSPYKKEMNNAPAAASNKAPDKASGGADRATQKVSAQKTP